MGLFSGAEDLQTEERENAAQTDGLGESARHPCHVREGTCHPFSPDTRSEERHPSGGLWSPAMGIVLRTHQELWEQTDCLSQVVRSLEWVYPGVSRAVTPRVLPASPKFQRQLPSESTRNQMFGTHVCRTKMGWLVAKCSFFYVTAFPQLSSWNFCY